MLSPMAGLVFILVLTILLEDSNSSERVNVVIRTGSYDYGQCIVEGRYTVDLDSFNSLETKEFHKIGSVWTERCRNCSCDVLGVWCIGPVCGIPYDFTQDRWCIRWSHDGCCCEQLGCNIDGGLYSLGSAYPYGEGNACLMCTCEIGTSRQHCLRQRCGTYSVMCEEGHVTYDEDCCPHYECPAGVFCDVIPDPFPDTATHELMDLYRGRLDPIPVGMTHHFHIDAWTVYECSCPRNGTAVCVWS